MSEYYGKSYNYQVKILPNTHCVWKDYIGQICDATYYEGDISPQINTEQLKPSLPKWQSIDLKLLAIVDNK